MNGDGRIPARPVRDSEPAAGRAGAWWPAAAILLAGFIAYHHCLPYPFVFDDEEAIAENPYIYRLWPPQYLVSAPPQSAVAGRPLIGLTLAVNYRLGGLNPWGYRLFNLAIHITAAWVLFGIVRRTLTLARLRDRFGSAATGLAATAALLWAVHPLQTESVTYIIQRCESLAGLLYLLTLYAAIRGAAARRPYGWQALAVIACALGMAAKEIVATAPVLVLLYDRVFLAASWREVYRRRAGFYAGLAASWVVLGVLVVSGPRSASAGFGLKDLTPLDYALSQPGVILHYLKLAFWPRTLCLDYWWPVARTAGEIVPPLVVVAGLLVMTAWALVRFPPAGFLGAWFLLILAPTSSVVPILDLAFEHRMYLPLAAVVILVVTGAYRGIAALGSRLALPFSAVAPAALLTALLVSAALIARTARRNEDYRSAAVLWGQVLALRPDNPRAHNNLAVFLAETGEVSAALRHAEEAVRLWPEWPPLHDNLGVVLVLAGRPEEAVGRHTEALRLDPQDARFYGHLAHALLKLGRPDDAVEQYEQALRINPDYVEARNDLAAVQIGLGRASEAARNLRRVLGLRPDWAEAWHNLGRALADDGRGPEAVQAYQQALRYKPRYVEAHYNLGNILLRLGKAGEAAEHYQAAVRAAPDYIDAYFNLAVALRVLGRTREAGQSVAEGRQCAFRRGDELRAAGRIGEAAEVHGRAALGDPTSDEASYRLGRDLMALERWPEAAGAFRRAAELNPQNSAAREALAEAESKAGAMPGS